MAAWCYEGVLLFGVVWIAGYLFDSLSQSRSALDYRHMRQAFLFVVFGIYFVWFWSRGQTLAMKTWHLRLGDGAGRPVSQPRALLRYLLSWVWILPPLIMLAPFHVNVVEQSLIVLGWVILWAWASRLHPTRQFWHDQMAGTRVVQERPRETPQ